MDSTTIVPPDLVVMAQQIQALMTNVQELMKQNEDLKWWVHPEGTNMSQLWRNHNNNDDKAHSLENNSRENFEHTARLTTMIRWWKIWERS